MDPLTLSAAIDALAGYASARLAEAVGLDVTRHQLEPGAENVAHRNSLAVAASAARHLAAEALDVAEPYVALLEEALGAMAVAQKAGPAFLNTDPR